MAHVNYQDDSYSYPMCSACSSYLDESAPDYAYCPYCGENLNHDEDRTEFDDEPFGNAPYYVDDDEEEACECVRGNRSELIENVATCHLSRTRIYCDVCGENFSIYDKQVSAKTCPNCGAYWTNI